METKTLIAITIFLTLIVLGVLIIILFSIVSIIEKHLEKKKAKQLMQDELIKNIGQTLFNTECILNRVNQILTEENKEINLLTEVLEIIELSIIERCKEMAISPDEEDEVLNYLRTIKCNITDMYKLVPGEVR